MKVNSQLERAQLENLNSLPSAATAGRVAWNTTDGKAYIDDATNWRAFLRNDAHAIIGNSGTAANNIRLHRGANGVLQFVSGADATAEGTLSTALNQISGRLENYTAAGKPAAGNAGRMAYITDTGLVNFDNGGSWIALSAAAIKAPPTMQVFNSGSSTYNKNYTFVINSGNATVGATYTNNGITYTVYATVASALQVVMSGNGAPTTSGTLTKASGTGDSTLTFTQVLAPICLIVEIVGAGGGGTGSGTSPGTGGTGTDTTFDTATAFGSPGGGANDGGTGGNYNLGSYAGWGVAGSTGGQGLTPNVGQNSYGGYGGNSFFGGNGQASAVGGSGIPAQPNTGSGGGGAEGTAAGAASGAGGGGGGYAKFIIPNPSATYAYGVGVKGTGGGAGTGGFGGANGADGKIIVWEHYQ